MHNRRCFNLLSGLAAALCLAAACCAQNAPSSLNDLITKVALTPQDVERVNAYVKFYSERLNAAASTPNDVERARKGLVEPFVSATARSMSPNFRGTFSLAAVSEMDTALKGKDMHRGANAAMVLAHIGTDRACNLLVSNSDIQNQPLWQVRLRAADGVRLLFMGGTLDSKKVHTAARTLSDATMREDQGLVLRNQLAALAAADNSTVLPDDIARIRALQATTLATVAGRIAAQDKVDGANVVAVASVVVIIRDRFATQFSKNERTEIGAQLGPALGKLLDWARAHWDAVRADGELSREMGILVAACEGLLQRIDPAVTSSSREPPASDMNGAWKAGDKAKFETGVKAWQDVLTKPPYKS